MPKLKIQFHSRRAWIIIPIVCLFISALVIFFNTEQLTRNPFDSHVLLDEPTSAVENASGISAVLDNGGTRVLIISPEGDVIESISYSSASKYTPSQASDIAMTETQLFILDLVTGANGTTSAGDRVLVYDLDGGFQKILIDSEFLFSEEHQWRIYTLATEGDRVYATLYDEMDPFVLLTAEITDGSLNIIHTFDTGDIDYYDAFYSPAQDCTTAVAYNGDIAIWQNEDLTIMDSRSVQLFADDIRMASDGCFVVLDQNARGLFRLVPGENSGKMVTETSAVNFSVRDDELIFADPIAYTFNRVNLNSGEKTTIGDFTLSREKRITGFAVWACVILGAASAILLISVFIITWAAKRKEASEKQALTSSGRNENAKKLTNGRLYGSLFATFVFIFAVMAFILGRFYYEKEMGNRLTAVTNAGYTLREISGIDGLGDALEDINSQTDYGSEAYQKLTDGANAVFMSGLNVTSSLNLPYQIYRFVENSNDLMVVVDYSQSQRIGLILTENDQDMKGLLEPSAAAKEGVALAGTGIYNNGVQRYTVYEPIYNSAGEAVGLAAPILNLTLASTQIMDELTEQLVTIFTLLIGLLMICAEMNYFLRVWRLKRLRRRQGITRRTMVEISRPLEILFRLPAYVYMVFITLITSDVLKSNGIDNTLLLAMPLTLDSISYTVARTFSGPIVKYRPRIYLLACIAGTAFSFILMGGGILFSNYVLLLVSALGFGVTSGAAYATTKTVYFSGIEADPQFDSAINTKLEPAIASAIGASIGSVLRSIWGDTALIIYVLVVCVLHALVVLNFVYDDLNASPNSRKSLTDEARKKPMLQRLKSSMKFYLQPDIICLMLAALIPIYILDAIGTYLLPLFNQHIGLSDVYLGLITSIMTMVAIFIVPRFKELTTSGKKNDVFWIAALMAALAGGCALFGFNTEMKTMVLVMVIEKTNISIFNAMSNRMNIREAAAMGLNPMDTDVCFEIARSGASTFNNVILGFMITKGYTAFGWNWCAICAGCSIFAAIIYRVQKAKKA